VDVWIHEFLKKYEDTDTPVDMVINNIIDNYIHKELLQVMIYPQGSCQQII